MSNPQRPDGAEPPEMGPLQHAPSDERLPNILFITAAVEGALLLIALLWAFFRSIPLPWRADPLSLSIGLVLALTLVGVNVGIVTLVRRGYFPELKRFLDSAILPLLARIGPLEAPVIAILAGLGEETLFRGVLQAELGILLSSALFSAMHFGRALRHFPQTALLYFCLSVAIGWFYARTESLSAAILAHACYDYVLILLLQHWLRAPTTKVP